MYKKFIKKCIVTYSITIYKSLLLMSNNNMYTYMSAVILVVMIMTATVHVV